MNVIPIDDKARADLDVVLNALLPFSTACLLCLNFVMIYCLWTESIRLVKRMKRIAYVLLIISSIWLANNELRRKLGLQDYQGAISKGLDFVLLFTMLVIHVSFQTRILQAFLFFSPLITDKRLKVTRRVFRVYYVLLCLLTIAHMVVERLVSTNVLFLFHGIFSTIYLLSVIIYETFHSIIIFKSLKSLLRSGQRHQNWLIRLKHQTILMIAVDYISILMNLFGNLIGNWLVTDLSALQTSFHIILSILFNMGMRYIQFPDATSFSGDVSNAPPNLLSPNTPPVGSTVETVLMNQTTSLKTEKAQSPFT